MVFFKKKEILQSIGVIVIKSKETSYTCRYSSGHLIPTIQSCQDELGIKFPLKYLQALVTTLVFLLFITMIPIDMQQNYNFFLIFVEYKSRLATFFLRVLNNMTIDKL